MNPEISVVIPVYYGEHFILKLYNRLLKVFDKLETTYEIIFINDASPDASWDKIKEVALLSEKVIGINLSRNFGQHPAIMAGLTIACGNWIVVMDCDLQDQPEEIEKLYRKSQEDFDIVLARRVNRKDGFFKKMSSKLFAKIYGFLTETEFNNEIANFGIYRRDVIEKVLEMGDYIKSFPLFINWVGFNKTSIPVEHSERYSGKSSYSYSKLFSLAFNTMISFSNKPLKIFVVFGLIISSLSFLLGLYYLYLKLTGSIEVLGYSSLIISIWFLSGNIIAIIGITGVYIGKVFDQTKNRPSFIIDKIIKSEL